MATKYQARHSAGSSKKAAEDAKQLSAILDQAKKKSTESSTAAKAVKKTSTAKSTAAASKAKSAVNKPAPIKTTQTRKASGKSEAPDPLISATQVMRSVSLDEILAVKREIPKAHKTAAEKPAQTKAAAAKTEAAPKVKTTASKPTKSAAQTAKPAVSDVADAAVEKQTKAEPVKKAPAKPSPTDIISGAVENPKGGNNYSKLSVPEVEMPENTDEIDIENIEDYEEAKAPKKSKNRYKSFDGYDDDYVDDRKFTVGRVLRIVISAFALIGMLFFAVPIFKNYFTGTSILAEIYCFVIFALSTFKGFITKHGKRLAMTIVWYIAAVVMFLSTCWFGYISYQMYAVDYTKPTEPTTVVVLGAKVYANGVSISLKNRLDSAYTYIATHPESNVVVTGGQGNDEPWSEASAAKAYLLDLGVDEDRILLEDRSTSTMENLEFTKKVLADNGLDNNILLVTQGFHMFRASSMAKDLGYTVYCQSCETNNWLFPTYYSRELLAITKYYIDKIF